MSKERPQTAKCKELFATFLLTFPDMKGTIDFYGPLDRNSIRIKTTTGLNLVFEYKGQYDWSLNTEKYYFNSRQAVYNV